MNRYILFTFISIFLLTLNVAFAGSKSQNQRNPEFCKKANGSKVCELVQEKPYEIVLYAKSSCPYCQKVKSYLKSIGNPIPVVEVGSKEHKFLVKTGGKGQVPCLFIKRNKDSEWEYLYESSHIISWLKATYGSS